MLIGKSTREERHGPGLMGNLSFLGAIVFHQRNYPHENSLQGAGACESRLNSKSMLMNRN